MEKKTERIKFWLTDKELKQIDRKAKKLGMNRSEYIRYLIANCKLVHTPSILMLYKSNRTLNTKPTTKAIPTIKIAILSGKPV